MRCGSGLDDGAAAGVGELVSGVDATYGNSDTLGGFDDTLCGTKSRRSGAVGSGADAAPRRCSSMRSMSWAPLLFGDGGGVEVFPRRCAQPRHGVHRRAVGVRAQHRAVGGGDRGADGRDGVADRAAGRRQPVVGRGAGAGCASPEMFDSSMTITGSASAPRPCRPPTWPCRAPAGRAPTASSHVDRGRSVRMAGGQTAWGLPCS